MRNTNLYFGLTAAASQAFANVDCSGAQTFQLTTGGFNNPIPVGVLKREMYGKQLIQELRGFQFLNIMEVIL